MKKLITRLLKKRLSGPKPLSHAIEEGNDDEFRQELLQKIKALDPWFYPLHIKGIRVIPGIGSNQPWQRLNVRTLFREQLLVDRIRFLEI